MGTPFNKGELHGGLCGFRFYKDVVPTCPDSEEHRDGLRITGFLETIINFGKKVNLKNHFGSKWGTVYQSYVNYNRHFVSADPFRVTPN